MTVRFSFDILAIVLFLKYLHFFLNMKVEKLLIMGKGLTCFHKSVVLYIMLAVFLQLLGSILRSIFAPLALV